MPASERSLRLTELYRSDLRALVDGVQVLADHEWASLDFEDLSASYQPLKERIAVGAARAQRQAVQVTAAYLSAFKSSELGRPQGVPTIDSSRYVGKSFGGRDLLDSLEHPVVAVLSAIGRGEPDPLGQGRRALILNLDLDVKAAARAALQDAMVADDLIEGWRRAVAGTCGACLGASDESTLPPGTPLNIHPNCECVSEPVVRGVRNAVPRLGGAALFSQMTPEKQDAAIGIAAAEKVRQGEAQVHDFIEHQRPGDTPGFIVQRPVEALR